MADGRKKCDRRPLKEVAAEMRWNYIVYKGNMLGSKEKRPLVVLSLHVDLFFMSMATEHLQLIRT